MKILKEFKEFISKGNVMDLAIGVIIGSAFTGIVNSLVEDIFMPLISAITGSNDFNDWVFEIGAGENSVIRYGSFISAVINFLIISAVIFMMIKIVSKFTRKEDKIEEPTTKTCPYCKSEVPKDATKCAFCTSNL